MTMMIVSFKTYKMMMKRFFFKVVPTPKRRGARGRKYALDHFSRLRKKP